VFIFGGSDPLIVDNEINVMQFAKGNVARQEHIPPYPLYDIVDHNTVTQAHHNSERPPRDNKNVKDSIKLITGNLAFIGHNSSFNCIIASWGQDPASP
jgi:hypothetical protein